MAFFKFRKGGDGSPAAPSQPESIEALRRRARHRLIGAAVLVLAGVVGFPLLFDTQPRPVAVDIPIEIPDRQKAKPLPAPAATQPVAAAPAAPAPAPAPALAPAPAPTVAKAEPAPAPAAAEKPAAAPADAPKPVAKADPASAPAAAAKPPAKEAPKETKEAARDTPSDGARAQALLEGKPVEVAAAGSEARFIVQVGAFADADKAREARLKLERAGLKTYTHVAETKEGKRIRVRVGPFGNRSEADKAADRIKGLDLPAAILTL